MRKPRVVRCTIEMDLVEDKHFARMRIDASDKLIINEARYYFYKYVKDQMAGGEINEWAQFKVIEDVS